MASAAEQSLLIDVHTHVYLPSYMEMLRKRKDIPLVHKDGEGQERIILLKEEAENDGGSNSHGRPVGPQYWDRDEKIKFMDLHGIDVSIVSLANPWLDFLAPEEAISTATAFNAELEDYCSTYVPSASKSENKDFVPQTKNRLFAFGSLPLVPGIKPEQVKAEIDRIGKLEHLKGLVMGTKGVGKGLDDPAMEPIYEMIAEAGLTVFVHPHYGIEGAFGEQDNGHVLPLGLGFPFETSIAIARLILAGVLDRHTSLKLLLAHSAGALPALSSRLSSCVAHDPSVRDRLQNDFRYYLGMLYYDAVAYGAEELALVERVIARADEYEGQEEQLAFVDRVTTRRDLASSPVNSSPKSYPGTDRIMFGTDHPFFPPLGGERTWRSVDENVEAIASVPGWGEEERRKVYGGTAKELFGLKL